MEGIVKMAIDMGGSIEIIQGSLGSGKSAVAVVEGIMHLKSGGVLATNFDLVSDWSWRLAGQNLPVWLGLRNRYKYAESLYNRCFKIGRPDTMYDLSERFKWKDKNSLCIGKMRDKREGRGMLIIDEAQLYFNSRNFSQNKDFIQFFSQARKLGWRTILVAHSIEMIDKQIRFFIEIESRFRNLKKVKVPFLPIPMSPFNTFVINRYYAGLGAGRGTKHSMDMRMLDKLAANLYDSFEVFAFDDHAEKTRHQGEHPSEITAAIEYYQNKYGEKPLPVNRNRYTGNIKGPYSLYRPIIQTV